MRDIRPRILFVSYNGLIEPLGPTQIVPYVRALAADYRMSLLSFEKPVGSPEEEARAQEQLASRLHGWGIRWIRLRYHKRPSLPASLFDIAQGILRAAREHGEEPFSLVHARGYVPGAIAWGLKRWLGIPYLFDLRGLQAEEYVDAGHWRPQGLRFRVTKRVEQWILRDADGLVTLTESIRPILREFPGLKSRATPPPWEVIPCCVDLTYFRFRPEGRARVRGALRIGSRPVVVYAGSLGTWYLLDEMLDFYCVARERIPGLFLLLLTNARRDQVQVALRQHGIPEADSTVQWVRSDDMPDYLSAADAGLAFIRPCLSKQSSSPTKYAEYLACGLPLVINRGIGDADALIEQAGAGVLVKAFTREAYLQAAKELRVQLLRTRDVFRAVAERYFSLASQAAPAYRRLYTRILKRQVRARLLFLTPYPMHCAPSQHLKFEQYYAYFEEQGFEMTVSPFVSPALWNILYERGHVAKKVAWTIYGYFHRLRDFLRAGRFDAVYLHLWAVPFGPPWFEEALARRAIPIIYDIDDLIYLPHASQANSFINQFRREERFARIMKSAQHVIVSTEYLRRFTLRYNPSATRISSTVNALIYYPRRHSSETCAVTVGWSGSHSTSAYLRLLTPVFQELVRRFDLRLLVIGDVHFHMDGVRVEARPWDVKRETADLAEMDIGVYPLPDEEWVLGKSGLKALQYMGMGVPVVASGIGAACEFIRDGENGFLVRSIDEWVDRISRLICEPALRAAMGRAGRMTIEERFSVQVTAPVYVEIIDAVLGRRPIVSQASPMSAAVPTCGPVLRADNTLAVTEDALHLPANSPDARG